MWTPDAYLFDMDGLLLDTERVFQRAFMDVTARLGVDDPSDESFFVTLVGTSHKITSAALAARFGDAVTMQQFYDAWHDAVMARFEDGVPVRPTVREVLADLSAQGARMAVVTSSTTRHATENLGRAGLLDHFLFIKGGEAVSANKPDPAPYLEAAAQLGLCPTRCAAFEDSDSGITAAMGAGCRSVQIPDLRPPARPLPELGQLHAPDLRSALDAVHQTPA